VGRAQEWNGTIGGRWQVLDQTGNDIEMGMEMDLNEDLVVQQGERVEERRNSNMTIRPRVRQPGTGSVDKGGQTAIFLVRWSAGPLPSGLPKC
jgi:hypothetical protein